MHTSREFILHGGDMAFANRQKALFDQLSIAEKQCNKDKGSSTTSNDTEMDIEKRGTNERSKTIKKRNEMKRFRGRESIFKRPEGPAPRAFINKVPDHLKNPHKWVKYSLDDVSNEDMTDKSNTQAAMGFLKELRKRKLAQNKLQSNRMDVDEPTSKDEDKKITFKSRKVKSSSDIQFKKPSVDSDMPEMSDTTAVIDTDEKPMFRSSKIIMPEYVVGQKQKKKIKKGRSTIKSEQCKQLKLDHLQEADEEEH